MTKKKEEQSQLPAHQSYGDYGVAGKEEIDNSHFKKPFLTLLQDMSPQVREGELNVPDARPGMFINSATKQLYSGKDGITLIPCHAKQVVVERTPRRDEHGADISTGGRFVKEYAIDNPFIMDLFNKNGRQWKDLKNPQTGNDLENNFQIFGVRLEKPGDTEPAELPMVVSFRITKIKAYQEIMQRIRTHKDWETTPLFANQLHAVSFMDRNQEGSRTFYNYRIKFSVDDNLEASLIPNDMEHKQLLDFCFQFQQSVKRGETTADYESEEADATDFNPQHF